jgi:type I restriction enzyme S subunit
MRDGWVKTTFGDVARVTSGFAFSTKSWRETGIPVIKINNVRNGHVSLANCSFVSDPLPDGASRFLLKKGDLLITLTGEIGAVGFVTQSQPMYLNQRVGRIDLHENKNVLLDFLGLFLTLPEIRTEMWSHGKGNAQLNISPTSIHSLKINLPPLPEQKRIVDLISSVDSYIEALQQQLESAKRSRNAVLHELLTAGGDDWVETTLGQEFEICKNGKNYKDGISTEGIPISRIQTIASGKIDLTKVGFGNLFLEDAEGFLLEEGDILFSHINSLPHVGKVAIVQHNHLPLIHGMNLLRMRFTNSNDTNFMFYLMQNESMRDEIKSRAQIAVNQVSINISSIKTIKIVIPPLRTQIEIASMIGAWDSLIEECENNLNSSRNLRVGLLSELLSGEHEIPASYDKVMGAA